MHRLRLLAASVAAGAVAWCGVQAPSTPTAAAAGSPAAGQTGSRGSQAACPAPAPGTMACLARVATINGRRVSVAGTRRPAVAPATAGSCATAGGYGPAEIQSAYNIAAAAAETGATQTVAIIDAYDNPSAAADLANYRSCWGLPSCTPANGCFTKVDQTGGTAFTPAGRVSGQLGYGWGLEIALDLDAVSAACPNCHILLVEANSGNDSDLATAVQEAVRLGATQLSMSFGGCEGAPDQSQFDAVLNAAARPITVASGDNGYLAADNPAQQDARTACPVSGAPSYPASSPYVTAAGGTSLTPSATARGWTETAWSYSGGIGAGSGCSSDEPKPAWQHDLGCPRRTVADVAADADPNTGLATYDTWDDSGWGMVGGTSLSAPLIAGIQSLGSAAPGSTGAQRWYAPAASVNDVTSGSNAPSGATDCAPAVYLCSATVGYDGPTGVGSPNGPTSPVPSLPFASMYAVDGNGFLYAASSRFVRPSATWPGWNIVRGIALNPDGAGGVTLDGWGGLHSFGSGGEPHPSAYWQGWDIAAGISQIPGTSGGYVLDGWGGLHPYSVGTAPAPPPAQSFAYWPGWSIVDGLASFPDGSGGVVLDRWGGVHPFSSSAASAAAPVMTGYWSGWDIARSVALLPGSTVSSYSGFVLDGWGGLHPFASSGTAMPAVPSVTPYWPGWDIARAVVMVPNSTGGYVVDGFGGFHPFNGAPAVVVSSYGQNGASVRAGAAA